MAEFPALPLFTDALLGDTTHLSQAEFGAYMLMLIVAWRSVDCSLPNDDKYLARITRSDRNWRLIKGAVTAFWTIGEDGQLRQKRLSKTRVVVTNMVEQRRNAGITSALKRKDTRSTTVEQPSNGDGNETSTTKTKTKSSKERVAKATPKKVAFGSLTLSPEMESYALEKGCTNVADLFGSFRDHHTARDTRFSDWVAAWRNWVRTDRKYASQNRSVFNGQRSGPAGGNSISRATMAVIEANRELELRANGVHRHEDVNGNGARRGPVGGEGTNAAGGQGNGGAGDWTLPILDQEPGQGGH